MRRAGVAKGLMATEPLKLSLFQTISARTSKLQKD